MQVGEKSGYDHWTYERLGNSSETDWTASSPMDAYGVQPWPGILAQTDAKVNTDSKYDHWTFERLGNSSETDWVASSPIAGYGVDPAPGILSPLW